MKRNITNTIVLITNSIAIIWLAYLGSFNTAVKSVGTQMEEHGEIIITPLAHVIFPIIALLISSFIFIYKTKKNQSAENG